MGRITEGPIDRPSVIFEDVDWPFYEQMLQQLDGTHQRVTYDGTDMEVLMTLSAEHEGYTAFIANLINRAVESFGLKMAQRNSITLKSEPRKKGLEPDTSFWIENAEAIRKVKRIDLRIHPRPDLVLEVDITHAAVKREAIYLDLDVPEMWHFNTKTRLTGWKNANGNWERTEFSLSLPKIRVTDLNALIDRFDAGDDEADIFRDYRVWLEKL